MKIFHLFFKTLLLLFIANTAFAVCPAGDGTTNALGYKILYFGTSTDFPTGTTTGPLGSQTNPIKDWNSGSGGMDAINDCNGNVEMRFVSCYFNTDGDFGDINYSAVLTNSSIDNVILDGQGAFMENLAAASSFLRVVGRDNWTIKNFTFSGWNANALLLTDMTNTVIENCVFDSNPTQRAVRVDTNNASSDVVFNSCVFSNNPPVSETSSTGAVEIREDENPETAKNLVVTFNNCDFSCNARQGFGGGALWISPTVFPSANTGPTVNINGGSFVNNFSGTDTGDGGAIGINGDDSFLNIDGTLFSCNHSEASTGNGGGGAIRIQSGPTVDITNATFYGNFCTDSAGSIAAGGYGGAINISSGAESVSTLTVSNSSFTGQQASRGGAFYLESGVVSFDNVLVTGNTAVTDNGGGVNNAGAAFTIVNTSITGNSPDDITGAVTDNGGSATTTNPAITACEACAQPVSDPSGCEADGGIATISNECLILCSTGDDSTTGTNPVTDAGQGFDLTLDFVAPICELPTAFTFVWLVVDNTTGEILAVQAATDADANGIPDAAEGTAETFDFATLGIAPGTYNIYGYHYLTADADAATPAVGSNISALDTSATGTTTSFCDELGSASPDITVLNPVLISIETTCVGAAAGEFNSTLTITGGLPEFNGAGSYNFTTNTTEFTSPYTFGTTQTQGITFTNGSNIDVTVTADGNMIADANCISCSSTLVQEPHLECVVCPATQDFIAPTTACSGGAIDWSTGPACTGISGDGFTETGIVVDVFVYQPAGVAGEAPAGYESTIDLSVPTELNGGIDGDDIRVKNVELEAVGFCFTCASPPSVNAIVNQTCAPITVTYFTVVFNWDVDTDSDTFAEYAPDCTVERYDVVIYPEAPSVVVTDDGSSCGTPTVELRAADGSVCSTQSGVGTSTTATGSCAADGDALMYDFTNDPIITALAGGPAACQPIGLTGTVTCAACGTPAITIVKDDNDNSDDTQAVSPGGTATFSITVTNSGTVDLENVTVTDPTTASCDNVIGNLAIGASVTYTCTSTNVTAAFVNTANVTGDPIGGGNPVTDTDDTDVTVLTPAITIVKDDNDNSDDTQAVSPGGTATFSITVTNSGTVDLENVTVTDPTTASCDNVIGNLTIGASVTYTCTSTNVTAAFVNTANVTGDPIGGGNPVTDTDDTDVTVLTPAITIVKDDNDNSDDTQAVSPGGTATFSITVTNSGTVDLENVTVTDPTTASCDNVIGNLAIGASVTYTCTSTNVTAAFVNTANVTGDPIGGGNPVTDTDDTDVTVLTPAITIVKDDNDNSDDTQAVSPGGTATFSITVTNSGTVDLENVTVTDPTTASCDNVIGNLAIGASVTYTCTSTNVTAAFVNTANVTGDPIGGGNPVTDTDDTDVTVLTPAITIVKDDNDNSDDTQAVSPGGTATFSITVTNSGTVDLENVTVTDPTTASCDNVIGNLAIGASVTYTCTSTNVTAAFVNTANVTGDPIGGGNPVTDTDDTDVTIGNPAITVVKTAADGTDTQNVLAGGTATFEITVTNTGDLDLKNVEVVDALSPNCNNMIGDLAVGTSVTYTCTIDNVSASFVNVAVVIGDPIDDGTPVSDDDDTDILVPSINIEKTAADGTDSQIINIGGTATFEITVTNTGDVDLENVTVSDALSPNCDNVIGNLAIGQVVVYTCTIDGVTENFVNIAAVTGDPIGGGDPVTDEDDTEVLRQDPELVITKSNEPSGVVCQNGTITYTLEVTNTATGINAGIASNVTISDVAPANTTLVAGSTAFVSGIAPTVSSPATPNWVITALAPGQSTTVSFEVTVNTTAQNGDLIVNVASVTTDELPIVIESNEVQNVVDGPVITCRQPISTSTSPGECGNNTLVMLPPFFSGDNCGGEPNVSNDAPAIYPVGTTIVTHTVTYPNGFTTSCEQTVTIADTEFPIVPGCTTDIVWAYDNCMAQVSINIDAADNCGIASIEGNGVFNLTLGIYPREIIVTDNNGNITTHTITVYVHDDIEPEATVCPESVTISSTDAETFVLPQPTFIDNCEIMSISNDAPETLEIGTTTVTWQATDTYGLHGYCSYDVIVEPVIAIGGLQDIETCVEDDAATAAVRWNVPQVTTLCAACPTTDYEDFTHLGDFNGNQYFVYTGEAMPWENAVEMAQTLEGGHLVTVNNRAENNYLRYALPSDVNDVWLGLEVTEVEGAFNYNWANDTTSDYQNFGDVIYYTETENVLTLQNTGAWTFTDKTELRGFIVERSCVAMEQTGPYLESITETGDTVQTLLTNGSEWGIGTYTVSYRAYDDCGNEVINTFDVDVAEPQAEYCATGGRDASVWIQQLAVKDQRRGENQTGGYFDNTDDAILFDAEYNVVRLELVSGGNTTGQDLFWSIWLDKNDDGDFFDADELIHTQMSHEAVIEAFISIMEFDNTERRMRVAVSRYDYPEVCSDYFSGEAEDYLLSYDGTPNININLENGDINTNEELTDINIVVTPNPAVDYTNISMPSVETKTTLTVLNTVGQVVRSVSIAAGSTSYRLLTKDFVSGLYILNFDNGEEIMVTKKLMIQR